MKKLKILYEDKYLIAVFKKSHLPTIKDKNHVNNLYSEVYDYLHKKNQKVFIVHRLDADTSGIVLFAKNETVRNNLQVNWDNCIREYVCVVHGKINNKGVIKSYLKETKSLISYSTNDKKNGKYAETFYERIDGSDKYSLVKINIKTGRKKQIRVHMKDNKTPIYGDKKYGINDKSKEMYLLANRLFFVHPITRKRIDIKLDIPTNYLDMIKKEI